MWGRGKTIDKRQPTQQGWCELCFVGALAGE